MELFTNWRGPRKQFFPVADRARDLAGFSLPVDQVSGGYLAAEAERVAEGLDGSY